MLSCDRSMFDTYRSYSMTRPEPETIATLHHSYMVMKNAVMRMYHYFFPPVLKEKDDVTSFEDYMYIKFGLTYHLHKNVLTPVSSRGTIEDGENSEIEDYINARFSRSISSPY
jgi:hypothetical protein